MYVISKLLPNARLVRDMSMGLTMASKHRGRITLEFDESAALFLYFFASFVNENTTVLACYFSLDRLTMFIISIINNYYVGTALYVSVSLKESRGNLMVAWQTAGINWPRMLCIRRRHVPKFSLLNLVLPLILPYCHLQWQFLF